MKAQLLSFIARHAKLKAWLKRLLDFFWPHRSVSSGYVPIASSEALAQSNPLRESWKNEEIPIRQRQRVEQDLARFKCGNPIPVFDVLVGILKDIGANQNNASILEIGCSSGYYGEVFQIAGLDVRYHGCDYSDCFITMAKQCYPQWPFAVADATQLHYRDGEFDIAISGCCLLHIPDYPAAIAETARVASRYAIFHRTPMVVGQDNQYFRKQAYGVETVEIHFNEPEFLSLLHKQGLEVIASHTLSESISDGRGSAVRTYVCRKVN